MVGRTILASAAALAGSAFAAPAQLDTRQMANIDTTVLQFALTLEHLENTFYKQALQKFSSRDFENAGYGANYYNNLKYIAFDEQQHVQFLQAAITGAGATPVQPCTYNFPYTDVPSFITLSSVLEDVGTSAYLGAAGLITNKQYLTAAGAILVTEAKHTAYQRNAVNEVPFTPAYGTPLDPMSVYTLAAMFITSCPAGNTPLPFTSFPTLQVTGTMATNEEPEYQWKHYERDAEASKGEYKKSSEGWPKKWNHKSNQMSPPMAGDDATFMIASGSIPQGSYVTFVNGLNVISVPAKNINGQSITATIPQGVSGQVYTFVTKSAITTLQDSQVLYGPAVLEVKPAPPAIDFSEY